MFSFIKSKTSDLNKRREFIDAHSLYENYSLRFSSSRFLLVSWGQSILFEIDSFDSVVVVIDGYCFLGSQRVDVKFVYEMFLKMGHHPLQH